MKNPSIQSYIEIIIETSEMEIEKSIAEDTMYNMISLYVKVRCFAKVRSILDKIKKKSSMSVKSKGLRKDLKKQK